MGQGREEGGHYHGHPADTSRPSHSTQCGVGKARSRGETNAVPRTEVAWYRPRWQDEGYLAQF